MHTAHKRVGKVLQTACSATAEVLCDSKRRTSTQHMIDPVKTGTLPVLQQREVSVRKASQYDVASTQSKFGAVHVLLQSQASLHSVHKNYDSSESEDCYPPKIIRATGLTGVDSALSLSSARAHSLSPPLFWTKRQLHTKILHKIPNKIIWSKSCTLSEGLSRLISRRKQLRVM